MRGHERVGMTTWEELKWKFVEWSLVASPSTPHRHLNGAVVSEQLCNRPALMVTGATGCLWPPVKADKRDESMLGERQGPASRFYPIKILPSESTHPTLLLRGHHHHLEDLRRQRPHPGGRLGEGAGAAAAARPVLDCGKVSLWMGTRLINHTNVKPAMVHLVLLTPHPPATLYYFRLPAPAYLCTAFDRGDAKPSISFRAHFGPCPSPVLPAVHQVCIGLPYRLPLPHLFLGP